MPPRNPEDRKRPRSVYISEAISHALHAEADVQARNPSQQLRYMVQLGLERNAPHLTENADGTTRVSGLRVEQDLAARCTLSCYLPDAMVADVKAYQREHHIPTFSAAIRVLYYSAAADVERKRK